jgi:cystathionine beta-lyase
VKLATRLLRYDAAPGDPNAPVSTPIYQTATFEQPSALECGPYDYSRSGNPTRTVLERQLASLEGAQRAFAYSSGMTALTALTRLVRPGEILLAGDDLYGGTYRLLSRVLAPQGIDVRFVDLSNPAAARAAIEVRPRLVLVETPTNPLLRIADVAALADATHRRGGLLAVDSSFLSPYLMQPLDLGADLVIQSATKYLSGHSDLTGGVIAVRDAALAESLAFLQNAEGTALGPFECWLLLRGLKTLAIRLDRQQQSAQRIAELLAQQTTLKRVRYPGLPGHEGREVHFRQARGAGAVLSFETGAAATSERLVERLRLFTRSVSFGSVGSNVSLPCRMSHASIPAEVRKARALPEDLIRLSIGIEDADDLIDDLKQALAAATR